MFWCSRPRYPHGASKIVCFVTYKSVHFAVIAYFSSEVDIPTSKHINYRMKVGLHITGYI